MMSRRNYTESIHDEWKKLGHSDIKTGNDECSLERRDKENIDVRVRQQKFKSIHFEEPGWRKRLSDQLEETAERMTKKRRYCPRMTPVELQSIMRVWYLLEERFGKGITSEQAVNILVGELGLSAMRIHAVLHGDPEHKLSEPNKLEVMNELELWMHQKLSSTDLKVNEQVAKGRPRRRSSACPPSVVGSLQSCPIESEVVRKRKTRSCSPRNSLSSTSQRDTPTTSRKRRLSHSLHSSTSSVSSREAIIKRASRPSYEPPSVKRRKLRQSGRLSTLQQPSAMKSLSTRRSEKTTFCPIEAAKRKILSEIKKLQSNGQKPKKNMELKHLELGLDVWERIMEKTDKVEVVVASIASNMDLSHLRLTRFLRGDSSNLLTGEETFKIAKKLEDWLQVS